MKISIDKSKALLFCLFALLTALLMWLLYFIAKAVWNNLHSETWYISSHIIALFVGMGVASNKDLRKE